MALHHHKLTIREAFVQASSLLTQSLQQQAQIKHLQNESPTTTKQIDKNIPMRSGQHLHAQSPDSDELIGLGSHAQSPDSDELIGLGSHAESPDSAELIGHGSQTQSSDTAGVTGQDAYAQSPDTAEVIGQDPQRVCEWLLLHLLDWDRAQLYLHFDDPFPQHKVAQWEEMLQRKIAGEPVQYIIGTEHFYGYEYQVNPAVLIPRPETELLVEAIIHKAQDIWPQGKLLTAADIGTGSGAIAVTLALQMPSWLVHATDLSAEALAVAMRNAAAHQVAARMTFHEGNLLTPFIEDQLALDVLISNPPYIPTMDMKDLQREVRDYEPGLALDGGVDGLDVYRKLIAQLAQLPQYPQLIGLEVGQGQARQVKAMLQACRQWTHIDIIKDLAEIERHVIGWC